MQHKQVNSKIFTHLRLQAPEVLSGLEARWVSSVSDGLVVADWVNGEHADEPAVLAGPEITPVEKLIDTPAGNPLAFSSLYHGPAPSLFVAIQARMGNNCCGRACRMFP
jgi:hypothetical protein